MNRCKASVSKHFGRVALVFAAVAGLMSRAASETVVVIQGFQVQEDTYAANTVDAYLQAFRSAEGSIVTGLRPASQPGWEDSESYTDEASLVEQLSSMTRGTETLVVVVGDADQDGLIVGKSERLSAADLADAISGAESASLLSAGCNALALDVHKRLSNMGFSASGVGSGQAAHTWPKGDRGQYDLFSRYLLEGYYLTSAGSETARIASAFGIAQHRMIHKSGGSQWPVSAEGVSSPSADGAPLIVVAGHEYTIALQVGTDGGAVGYVSNSLGLPLSRVQGGRVEPGRVSLAFAERGRSRRVSISDAEGVPQVTIDGRSSTFAYRPVRVELISKDQLVGTTFIAATLGSAPLVKTVASSGSEVATYDYDEGKLSFTIEAGGGSIPVSLDYGTYGRVVATVGDDHPYDAYNANRYGLYDNQGNRVASAHGVVRWSRLSGELRPAMGAMRLPLVASVLPGVLSGEADLLGTSYKLAEDWTWSSNRPPSTGDVQADFFGLPAVEAVYADASAGNGAVEVNWEVDNGTVSDVLLLGDLRFQVVRTDKFSGQSETFEIPAGRRQYTDRPSERPDGFEYSVRSVLDHRVATCSAKAAYPIFGETVVAVSGTRPVQQESTTPLVAAAIPASEPATSAPTKPPKVLEEPEPEPVQPKVEEPKQEEKEEARPRKIWEEEEKEGIVGKVIYGLFGVMILLGIAIAAGGGGGPSDLEPE